LHLPSTRFAFTQLEPAAMAPKAEKKPAKKVAKSTSSAAAKKRKLAKAETYKIYIYKVLKQVRLRRPQVLWKRLHLGALT